MVVVNNQGSGKHAFPSTAHAGWMGVNGADLVFPFFLLIVGTSMAFSFAGQRARGVTGWRLHAKVVRRSAVLILLGIGLNGLPHIDWAEVHLLGILQRIGLAYLLASLLVLHVPRRRQMWIAGIVLVGYWLALTFVPVPGHGAGHLTPGANLGGWLDRTLLGVRHLYGNQPSDPEGLLATLPAVVTVLIGWWAGCWLRDSRVEARTASRLAGAGGALVVGGMVWSVWFPMSKWLWTSSFVLFTGGFGLLLLAACYHLVEVRGRARSAWPWEVLGLNAILLYIVSEEAGHYLDKYGTRHWLWQHVFTPVAGMTVGALLYSLALLALLWVAFFGLYRRRLFLKV